MKYEPKTTAEQLALLVQWKAWARNNVSDAVTTVLDDLASAQARIAELEAMVRELVEAGGHLAMREIANHGGGSQALLWWNNQEAKALALLNQERKPLTTIDIANEGWK